MLSTSGPAFRPHPERGTPPLRRPGPRAVAWGVLLVARPRQWIKNILVAAAPALAGALDSAAAAADTLLAFLLFCAAASGTYLLNDIADAEADRAHARKRHRPIASGLVPVPLAAVLGALLIGSAPLVALAAAKPRLALVLVGYLALSVSYTYGLKHLPLCDIAAVAGCHVLRALAGGATTGVPITGWFLAVVSLGALLVVAGKREAELRTPASRRTRATLAYYTTGFLTRLRIATASAMVATYFLWAWTTPTGLAQVLTVASIVPLVMAVFRLHALVDRGIGEEPEELVLRDRPLQLCLAALGALVLLGVHVG